ncbi:MAG: hypothetical protein IBX47_12080 [Desulfuromonadales bacterium]|nr:hypothetical protein [Desulfuromonadales bacterium]
MRTLILIVLFTILTTGFALAEAGSVSLDFNDESAEGRVALSLSEDEYGKIFFNGRYLYNSDERTNLGSGALSFYGQPGNVPGLTVGAGFIGYIGKSNRVYETLNVGLIGEVEYVPAELAGVGFGATVAYAPKVFSFMDSDGLLECSSQAFYAITPKIHVYLKYQYIEGLSETAKDIQIDQALRFGLRAYF